MFYGFSWVTTIFCKSLLTCFQIQEPGVFCTIKMADFFPPVLLLPAYYISVQNNAKKPGISWMLFELITKLHRVEFPFSKTNQ